MLAARFERIVLNLRFANDDRAGKTSYAFSRQNVAFSWCTGAPGVILQSAR
jgi:hypothetical protein